MTITSRKTSNHVPNMKLSLLLVALPGVLAAQVARDTARVAPVVVTATRSPVAIGSVPASVTLLDGARLRSEGITTVVDALRQVPGLAVVQGGSYGGQTSVFIRGGESKFAKVLVDGVPVNDAGGAFDFSTLSTDNVDRIEIVRGPASVLYGSDAMAGVIQLFTRQGSGRPRIDASGRGGQLGSYDGDVAIRGASGAFTYSAAAAQHATDGIQPFNSGYRQGVGSALLGATAGAASARLSARFTENELHYPTNGSGEVVDSNAMRRDDRLAVGLDAAYTLTPLAELHLSLASHDVHGVTHDEADSPGDDQGYYFSTGDRTRRRSGDLRLDIVPTASVRLNVGVQAEHEWQASGTTSNFGPSAFTARRRTRGAYAQVLLAPRPAYTLTAGGRLERNDEFGDFATWRGAASAQLTPHTRAHASVGTAFREPTFLENFGGPFAIGNASLVPERSLGVDAGVQQDVGEWATLSATYFANAFRDLIDYKYSATAPNYNNIARTKSSGAEFEARATLPAGLRADASLTYLSTKVVDPGTSAAVTAIFSPGAHLLRRPMHTIDAGIGYTHARGTLDLRAHHVGVREDNYYAPDFSVSHVTLRPYTRADLSGELQLLRDARGTVTATARTENVFDTKYTDVAGFNYNFALSDDASIAKTGYRGAGRRTLIGLRIQF
ncbi:MAG: TonB-dependent receptor [Gemmatimonadaceae bacterium]